MRHKRSLKSGCSLNNNLGWCFYVGMHFPLQHIYVWSLCKKNCSQPCFFPPCSTAAHTHAHTFCLPFTCSPLFGFPPLPQAPPMPSCCNSSFTLTCAKLSSEPCQFSVCVPLATSVDQPLFSPSACCLLCWVCLDFDALNISKLAFGLRLCLCAQTLQSFLVHSFLVQP